ncbi:MAG: hypothetical protein KDK07_01050 [Bauldia sp.]|nr:hypothetical protein [Bauldia sp.]
MPGMILFIYAATVGFVVAGLAASAYRVITSEPVRFGTSGTSLFSLLSAIVVGAVLGPVIIVRQAFASARAGTVPPTWATAGVLLAIVWSCILGIAILAVAERLRDTLV